ncbi:hypothetical protein [Blastopirellula marina]|uniref:Uncharacterized protein n=1 Tax=Blastopirellula marina TaxID=124 RepID=A0A2S8GSH2_9BACT|nr:hypothetical protein [Blastopirellula marina]PQO47377.1 hypothetical protein C5Y93_04865 [Blastopirellula marina]
MPTNPELFYITVEDYRAQSQAPTLVPSGDEVDEEVEALILEGMVSIDAYIGRGWTPYEVDQEFIFPRAHDELNGSAFIPRAVALATRKVTDAILIKRQQQGEQGVLAHEVVSETNLGHSYSRTQRKVEVPRGFEWWPADVFALLEPFVRRGGMLGLDEALVL